MTIVLTVPIVTGLGVARDVDAATIIGTSATIARRVDGRYVAFHRALSIIPRDLHRRGRNSSARACDAQYPAMYFFSAQIIVAVVRFSRSGKKKGDFNTNMINEVLRLVLYQCRICDINL